MASPWIQPRNLFILSCPALLPVWGCVAWAEGSLKHKTTWENTRSRGLSHVPDVVEGDTSGRLQ